MTSYHPNYTFNLAFAPQRMTDVLAETLSKQGVKQCQVAETEKYTHVTFFFHGSVEKQFENEKREILPSPKVARYNLEPKMSALAVTNKLCERIRTGKFKFLLNNFTLLDIVGRTGVYKAAIGACTETDKAIMKVYD